MINFHYALQTCDHSSNNLQQRYCLVDKQIITKKCILSFFQSVENLTKKDIGDNQLHNILIVDDNSSTPTINFIKNIIDKFNCNNINISLHQLEQTGIMNSIKYCYKWLDQNGVDIVYQVQDDYLFFSSAIFELVSMFVQLKQNCNTDAIITGFNDPYHWINSYAYKSTPRMIIPGINRYWIQIYDIACTFLTSKDQFNNNWDIYNLFLNLPPNGIEGKLESISLNYMFTKKHILGVSPIQSVSLHLGSIFEKDPYIDWRLIWNHINTASFE